MCVIGRMCELAKGNRLFTQRMNPIGVMVFLYLNQHHVRIKCRMVGFENFYIFVTHE